MGSSLCLFALTEFIDPQRTLQIDLALQRPLLYTTELIFLSRFFDTTTINCFISAKLILWSTTTRLNQAL